MLSLQLHIGLNKGAFRFDGADQDRVVPGQAGLLVLGVVIVLLEGIAVLVSGSMMKIGRMCAVMDGLLISAHFSVLEITGQSLRVRVHDDIYIVTYEPFWHKSLPAVTGHQVAMMTLLLLLLLETCSLVNDTHKGAWLMLRLPRAAVGSARHRIAYATGIRQVSAGGAGHSHAAAPAKFPSRLNAAFGFLCMTKLNAALSGTTERTPLNAANVDAGPCSERGGSVAARHGARPGTLGRPALYV